jgi:alginate O-acetyltransferase complex protein AlgI
MVFSSLFFTFAFLPVTVILYYSLGKHFRNIVLLAASLFFYAWGEPAYVLLMCISIMINYILGTLTGRYVTNSQKNKLFLIISLVFNLGCLVYFKYFGMIISTIAPMSSWNLNGGTPALPIGISFYTFQSLSYVIDVYRGKIKPQKNLIFFALYITMFPQLVAGPIVNYADIEAQLADRRVNIKEFSLGMQRFLCGLAKKVLLANNIGVIWSNVKNMPATEISVVMAWAGIIAFTLQIYFDFSGVFRYGYRFGKNVWISLQRKFPVSIYFSKASRNFGRGGISRWARGLRNMYIFLLAGAVLVSGN